MTARVFIGIGSNLAPEGNVANALGQLCAAASLVAISTFFATPALDRPADPPFVNGVVEVEDDRRPATLKALLRTIEDAVGRHRSEDPYAPREIDLDLLLCGDTASSAPDMPLPHPDVTTRAFVALPLLELVPDLVLPGSGAPLSAVARSLPPYPMEPLVRLTQELRKRYLCDGCRQG